MDVERLSSYKNLSKKANIINNAKEKEEREKKIFCPACSRYVFSECIIAGICDECFMND